MDIAEMKKILVDVLLRYAEGWTKGILEIIMETLADDYEFQDPNVDGYVSRQNFPQYFNELKESVVQQLGYLPDPFMNLYSVLVGEPEDGRLSAWCRWIITDVIEGAGFITVVLVRVQENGSEKIIAKIETERIYYHNKIAA